MRSSPPGLARAVIATAGQLSKEGKMFSERPGAKEVAEKKPGDVFFSLPCVSEWRRDSVTYSLGRP